VRCLPPKYTWHHHVDGPRFPGGSTAAELMVIDNGLDGGPNLMTRATHFCSFAQPPARVFLVQFVGDAFVGEADELDERRTRP